MDERTQRRTIYPAKEDRQAMRRQLAEALLPRPAEYTATSLTRVVRERGSEFSEAALRLELSRMLGVKVRMNPNRTLSLIPERGTEQPLPAEQPDGTDAPQSPTGADDE